MLAQDLTATRVCDEVGERQTGENIGRVNEGIAYTLRVKHFLALAA